MIRYSIFPRSPAAHLFEVTVTIEAPDPAGQRFTLPAWIPGSYMIREFARHIVALSATAGTQPVHVVKTDKAAWQCAPCTGPLTLTYEVYAWDLSVRAAHLDDSHGFFNGTSVFLLPEGLRDAPCEVDIRPPSGERYRDWRVATSLGQTPASTRVSSQKSPESRADAGVSSSSAKTFGGSFGVPFGVYYAAHYDELIDHPVEMGTFSHASFMACGVRHHIAITGRHRADLDRLCRDLQAICEYQIKLFEPESAQAPMAEYWFLVMAVGDGYGGLEHRASTALICARDDLPLAGDSRVTPGYRKFLGLASHEYFHTWNVKRIRPERFMQFDLAQENYTRQLWFFEGITSYYDDLVLVRTGLITPLDYLELIAENIGRVMSQSGRLKQSVADSSFDAWIKYYRQDENAPNAIVSYYQKGSMIGLCLDLLIREKTNGARSLDDVMRALWREHGAVERGVPEGGVEALAARMTGLDLSAFFQQAVFGTADLALADYFATVGIDLTWKVPGQSRPTDPLPASLGAKIGAESNGDARLTQVFDDGAAQSAGLSAGDTIVALDGLRVNAHSLERRIRTYAPGSVVDITAFRRDELRHFRVTLQAQPASVCTLTTRDTPSDAKVRRDRWLGASAR
jgi:predicted metalloprotease with PDZ domain